MKYALVCAQLEHRGVHIDCIDIERNVSSDSGGQIYPPYQKYLSFRVVPRNRLLFAEIIKRVGRIGK